MTTKIRENIWTCQMNKRYTRKHAYKQTKCLIIDNNSLANKIKSWIEW